MSFGLTYKIVITEKDPAFCYCSPLVFWASRFPGFSTPLHLLPKNFRSLEKSQCHCTVRVALFCRWSACKALNVLIINNYNMPWPDGKGQRVARNVG